MCYWNWRTYIMIMMLRMKFNIVRARQKSGRQFYIGPEYSESCSTPNFVLFGDCSCV